MTKKPAVPSTDEERRSRLADALRANLRRRKEQARGRAEDPGPPPEAPAAATDQN